MAAVCRCFPGKTSTGGDRVPSPAEVANCSVWLKTEIEILRPGLVIPVGKLAMHQLGIIGKLEDIVGKKYRSALAGHTFDVIPLPHPSGASPWPRLEPGRTLLLQALRLIHAHPDFPSNSCIPPIARLVDGRP
jgi:uracil-DNA glycosylase